MTAVNRDISDHRGDGLHVAPTEAEVVAAEPETTVATLNIADDLGEMAYVRRWARDLLADLDEDPLTDALIVLDELVSNALRHGSPPHQVRLVRRAGWMRVEVDDGCQDKACPRSPYEGGGRGLALVSQCSLSWGQKQNDVGKTVWAEVTLTA